MNESWGTLCFSQDKETYVNCHFHMTINVGVLSIYYVEKGFFPTKGFFFSTSFIDTCMNRNQSFNVLLSPFQKKIKQENLCQ